MYMEKLLPQYSHIQNKVPDSGHSLRMPACRRLCTLDGLTGMSSQDKSPDCELLTITGVHKRRVIDFINDTADLSGRCKYEMK